MNKTYKEYFDINEEYFPQINDSSIKAAGEDFWKQTYPHQTFIEMLTKLESVLDRRIKKSLWIEGAYGTGKSQCAYALKKILDVEESELNAYWEKYESLKNKQDLLQELKGHKSRGVITAYRYASGGIDSPRKLFMAIQESVKASLVENNLYLGQNTLKENILDWLCKPHNKILFDSLLQVEEWASLFSQSSVEEVINALKNNIEISSLVNNIFQLADKEGFTAMSIDADRLKNWLRDVIKVTGKKIVFIWDEFSDYFKINRKTLSDFQKIVELVNDTPFYLIIVTHESGHLFSTTDQSGKIVRDRFIPVEIFLPDNIAFNLIGDALKIKQVALEEWKQYSSALNDRLEKSRVRVMNVAGIKEEKVIKDILPLHPMTAFALKNIATAFKSNQRSMFDFIKSNYSEDVQAFQWFIENRGPLHEHQLLTIDLLWDFFYEKGRNFLDKDIRLILDTYNQQQSLVEFEKVVLKAILIMQAIDYRLRGEIELFKATDQNLSYAFEGISNGLDSNAKNIAKALVNKGILIQSPLKNGINAYKVAILAGDQDKIDKFKKEIIKQTTTAKLVIDGELSTVLALSQALRLRLESEKNTGKLTFVTKSDFNKKINELSNTKINWKFNTVIAFARDKDEAGDLRELIKSAVTVERYKNIIFIDALSTPLGDELFEQYVDYSAMAMYYSGNNNKESLENKNNAIHVLEQEWKNKVYEGQFTIYTYENKEGEIVSNGQGVLTVLQSILMKKFPLIFDFNSNLTENQLKLTNPKASALAGIDQKTSGIVKGLENNILLQEWNIVDYWENPATSQSNISKIKTAVDELINQAFDQQGRVSIDEIYSFVESYYGFSPCNLSAFLIGFILKEYKGDPYRYRDSIGSHESMTPDKLAEMIGNYIGKNPKPTYIVKMTAEERAFYEFTESAWDINPNACSSIDQAIAIVSSKLKSLKLPVWSLEEVDDDGIFYIVKKFIDLIQSEGIESNSIMLQIGKIALERQTIIAPLKKLLSIENCQNGMLKFLKSFEAGRILELADDIGASQRILTDISKLFEVKHSSLWEKKTGEDEVRKLLHYYGVIKKSNILINVQVNSIEEIYDKWIESLNYVKISHEAIISMYPNLTKTINTLLNIYQRGNILYEKIKELNSELESNYSDIQNLLQDSLILFKKIYSPYLDNFEENEIRSIYNNLPTTIFGQSKTESNSKVKEIAILYRKEQKKTKMFKLWKDKTNSKTPKEWSWYNKTPILSCVDKNEFQVAKKVFEILNRDIAKDNEIESSIEYLETSGLFESLSNQDKLDKAFKTDVIGEYQFLLTNTDEVRKALEQLNIEPYDWRDNPIVKSKIKELAEAEYFSGGSDRALSKIDNMNDSKLKEYLKRLVKENMMVGIEIISNNGE